ncbi:MAG: hypothetical protein K9J30_03430 [Bacteroidales bacterium]|nr:hypothetical protein [Bacteroidales bacterium]
MVKNAEIILKDKQNELKFRRALFWDIPIKNINLKKNKRLIIERIFSRGNLSEFKQIINYYDEQEILEELKKIKSFDKKTLNFINKIYNINLKDINAQEGIG